MFNNNTMPGVARANLQTLTTHLEELGVDVPGLAQWRTLSKLSSPRPPARPERLLDATPEELQRWARDLAIHRMIDGSPSEIRAILRDLKPTIDEEFREVLEQHGDSIITQLRGRFDEAAGTFRAAAEMGLPTTATADQLVMASADLREAWAACQNQAQWLDRILLARQELSWVAMVPPVTRLARNHRTEVYQGRLTLEQDWSDVVLRPGSGRQLAPYVSESPWRRWLEVAEDLELVGTAQEVAA